MHNNMQPLKIGFLVIDKHTGIGGLENVLIDVTNGLKKFNIESVTFFLQTPEHTEMFNFLSNVKVLPPLQQGKKYKLLPKIVRHNLWKIQFKYQTKKFIASSLNHIQLDALIILNLSKNLARISPMLYEYKNNNPNVPIIAWPHISFQSGNNHFLQKSNNVFSLFDNIFAISKGIEKELQKKFHLKNTVLLYNPIKPAPLIIREPHRFLFLGRTNDPRKRVPELLTTLSKLRGNWHLDIIGGSGSEAKDSTLVQYIKQLGLSNNITFHGWQADPWKHVHKAGVLLLNSTHEGFGLVLVEAMMRGIPCISTDCPVGPNEIIKNDLNGWLYGVNDPEKLQLYLQQIIDGSRDLPPQKDVIASVQQFSEDIVINNFYKAIISSIKAKLNKI